MKSKFKQKNIFKGLSLKVVIHLLLQIKQKLFLGTNKIEHFYDLFKEQTHQFIKKKSNYINCKKCQLKFIQLEKRVTYLFSLLFTFILYNYSIKICRLGRKLVQKKIYERCQKFSLKLCFFDMTRKCESCKKEQTLLAKQLIVQLQNFKIFQNSHYLLGFGFSNYWDNYSGFNFIFLFKIIQSILSTIKDGYSNENCIIEQLSKVTLKQNISFIDYICVMQLG
ncbi:unnamed protein product [Paramecium sonneborni]|uniref:Transmembrane protein n=1 Tax=Paramecium sonneborni TaxID=65129 RepID=A0A8S1RRY6_9CILI|nr:unnamed protein product [Paramecium sonneborni]